MANRRNRHPLALPAWAGPSPRHRNTSEACSTLMKTIGMSRATTNARRHGFAASNTDFNVRKSRRQDGSSSGSPAGLGVVMILLPKMVLSFDVQMVCRSPRRPPRPDILGQTAWEARFFGARFFEAGAGEAWLLPRTSETLEH